MKSFSDPSKSLIETAFRYNEKVRQKIDIIDKNKQDVNIWRGYEALTTMGCGLKPVFILLEQKMPPNVLILARKSSDIVVFNGCICQA